jgi:hypothetical protein
LLKLLKPHKKCLSQAEAMLRYDRHFGIILSKSACGITCY